MTNHVVVTGGAGFIGRAVLRQLRQRGDDVTALVRDPARATTLRDLGVRLVTSDLGSATAIRAAVTGCDGVIHLAGSYRVGITPAERPAMYEMNVAVTARVLDAAIEAGIPRIMVISTANVFGDTARRLPSSATRRGRCTRGRSTPSARAERPGRSGLPAEPYYTATMARELPMFIPPGGTGHAHGPAQPPTIAMGGGLMQEPAADGSVAPRRHPDWIRSRMPSGDNYHDLKGLLRGQTLNTVCEEAHCPNIGECWDERTATIMILGDTCTRACGFCAIKTGRPTWFDDDEPRRVAEAVGRLGLEHVVVTSVARDDLPDGGASVFAETIRQMRGTSPGMGIEVLIPDFNGDDDGPAGRDGGQAGHPQPQPRDRPAPPEAGPQAGSLGPDAAGPRSRQDDGPGDRLPGPHQELADGRPGRGAGRAARGLRRPARRGLRHPDHRAVPAAVAPAPATRALLPPRRVRRDEGRRRSRSASGTSNPARSSAPATTPATRSRAPSSGAFAARRPSTPRAGSSRSRADRVPPRAR